MVMLTMIFGALCVLCVTVNPDLETERRRWITPVLGWFLGKRAIRAGVERERERERVKRG